MTELIYKKESYRVMGYCFKVFNDLGSGYREKTYQRAIIEILNSKGIKAQSEVYIPIKINGKLIDKHYIDILVNDSIVIELKVGDRFFQRDIDQLISYLKSAKLKLGLMINVTSKGIRSKRILNIK